MICDLETLESLWNAKADRFNTWSELGIDEILAFVQEVNGWRPIETAPKDRIILVFRPSAPAWMQVAPAKWHKLKRYWNTPFIGVSLEQLNTEPTCWLPQPEPPDDYPFLGRGPD